MSLSVFRQIVSVFGLLISGMPYENIVAPVLLLFVLLVPVLKWAKDKWMAVTILFRLDNETFVIRGATWGDLAASLDTKSSCGFETAKALIKDFAGAQLRRKRGWSILAEIAGMSESDYLYYAVRTGIIKNFSQLPPRSSSRRARIYLSRKAVLKPSGAQPKISGPRVSGP